MDVVDWPDVLMWCKAQKTRMSHLCVLTGYSGCGLGTRKRNGYGPRGLSDHAAESGPSTSRSRVRRQRKVQMVSTKRNKAYITKGKQSWSGLRSDAYYTSAGALCWWCNCITVAALSHWFPAGCSGLVGMRRTTWTPNKDIWMKKTRVWGSINTAVVLCSLNTWLSDGLIIMLFRNFQTPPFFKQKDRFHILHQKNKLSYLGHVWWGYM